ncbi:MAG: SDR family NAD(P)-dependent oxidoreductase [Actinobacteria bacterium]|nr:MAG: SDR family NAD(P)-dependent oxidoreductase [Actinomycetota bacterium]
MRAWEGEYLWDRATPSYPAVRREPESDSPIRTPFQRDRDRVVHSKAFRRLKHKTQVFIAPEGDHYRTRLTHTLETCGIARTVARALGLNEDLTEAIVVLTHAFLPGMVERGRGGIINVASSAGMQPIPYESVYAATKAFAISFTDALHAELRGSGVRILAVNPGPVPTEWQEVAGYGADRVSVVPGRIPAEQVVRESLAAYDRGRRSVIPGRAIRWFIRATRPSPRAIQLRVTERLYRPKE